MTTATAEPPMAITEPKVDWGVDGETLPPLTTMEIMNLIPHRYPFLLVDRVTHHIQGKAIAGYKNVSANEPFFNGHFPGNPIMPGVLQIEALAQIGSVMVANMAGSQGKLGVLAGVDNFRFRRIVRPGDRLDLYGELLRYRYPIGKAKVWAKVGQDMVVEGEIMFSLIDPDQPSE